MSMIPTREQIPQISRAPGAIGFARMAAPSGGPGMTAQDVLRIIRKRKWLIILSVLICVAVASAVTQLWLMYSPLYTAKAYLGVSPPGQTDLRRGSLTGEIIDRHKMSVARMAQTEPVFRKTIEKIEVKNTDWWKDNLADPIPSLLKATSVSPIRETNLIELSMTGQNKEELPEIVNAWAAAFVEDTTDNANKGRRATIERLQTQQEDLRKEMDRFDRDIKVLQFSDARVIQHKISLLTNELQTLTGQLTELRLYQDREMRNKRHLKEQEQSERLATMPEVMKALERDPTLRRLHDKLIDWTIEMAVRNEGKQDENARNAAARVAALRKLISEREKTVRESQIRLLKDSYDRRILMLTAQIQALSDNFDNAEAQVSSLQGNLRNVIEWQAEKNLAAREARRARAYHPGRRQRPAAARGRHARAHARPRDPGGGRAGARGRD